MIIQYSENNENRIEWQHRRSGEWRTAELHELIEAYEREKTGKWLKGNMPTYGGYKCSICGDNSISKFSYCPNCGARMENENG